MASMCEIGANTMLCTTSGKYSCSICGAPIERGDYVSYDDVPTLDGRTVKKFYCSDACKLSAKINAM